MEEERFLQLVPCHNIVAEELLTRPDDRVSMTTHTSVFHWPRTNALAMASPTHTSGQPGLSSDVLDGTDHAARKRPAARKTLAACLPGFSCVLNKLSSMSDDDEQGQKGSLDPVSPVGEHVHLRRGYELRAGEEIQCRRCGVCAEAECVPQPVPTPAKTVFLRKPGKYGIEFMAAEQTGKVLMRTISSPEDKGAQFLKKDYTLASGDYCSTFMSLLLQKYVAVDKERVQLRDFHGDPSTCVHPCLFIMHDTGTIQLQPTVAPARYLGYKDNVVVVTDQRISFEMLSLENVRLLTVTVTHPSEHLGCVVNTDGRQAKPSRQVGDTVDGPESDHCVHQRRQIGSELSRPPEDLVHSFR